MYTEFDCAYSCLWKNFVRLIAKYFGRLALGDNVCRMNWTNTKPKQRNTQGVQQISTKNLNKDREHSVIFTAMNSENRNIRGSNCKAFWNTAWAQKTNTSQCYVILQALLYPSDEDVLSIFWKIQNIHCYLQTVLWNAVSDGQLATYSKTVRRSAIFRTKFVHNLKLKRWTKLSGVTMTLRYWQCSDFRECNCRFDHGSDGLDYSTHVHLPVAIF